MKFKLFTLEKCKYSEFDNSLIMTFLGVKVRISYRRFYYIKRYIKARMQKYRIIPLGTYCFSRAIPTFADLKPQKDVGEKTCPFDLDFFNSVDSINELLSTNFKNFYDDLKYNSESDWWENSYFHAIFNHEEKFTKEKFIKRYNKRIKNLYSYLKDNKYKYFIITSREYISEKTIQTLRNTLEKIICNNNFKIILINISKSVINYNVSNVIIIEQSHNCKEFNKINIDGNWMTRIKKLDMPEAKKIYFEITEKLKDIIK